ncbi:phage tail protein [Paractinoplanes deccanensis]|uniref:phage tail protein n=1 Tax=Paractinoplanes deccanensis TaxID=113561 RepID=UPI00360C8BAA
MPPARAASLIATCDQWVRAWHRDTAVDGAPGALTLSWTEPADPGPGASGGCLARGLAVDRLCRVYRLRRHEVERLLVGPTRHGVDYARLGPPVRIVGRRPEAEAAPPGDFAPRPRPELLDGTGIAVDADDRLFLADRGRRVIAVLDLWSRRTLRVVPVAGLPMGLTAAGRVVHALVRGPAGLVRLTATRDPEPAELPGGAPAGAEPSRVALLPDGTPVVLWHTPDGAGWQAVAGRAAEPVGGASDIAVDATGAVVVAPCPSPTGARPAALRRLLPAAGGWTRTLPLDAAGYDGSGIVATGDGRVGYWTAAGFRLAARGRVRYAKDGTCVTYRLDSGQPRNRWGRIILDGCLPPGTDCRVAAVTSDDDFETGLPPAPADPAACEPGPGKTPPLPPDGLAPTGPAVAGAVHRRRDAPTPWWRPAAHDPVDVFEAPVTAPPGRYLWISLRLTGDGSSTPSVRALRVERQAHDLVRRLPAVFAEGLADPSFLDRYLAIFDSLLYDLDQRAARRDVLLDPAATPVEALPWLASFAGLVLDDRWPEAARRRLLAEIVPLYRRRGTAGALTRYLELLLGRAPILVEHFRLRGLAPRPGGDPLTSRRAVVGFGFRLGDTAGTGAAGQGAEAHRFTVVVPQPLSAEQDAAVRHVLDTERPAHTAYELCTVDAGMRAGSGLHVGLTSLVGPTGAMTPLVVGASVATAGTVLGGAGSGLAVEGARLDRTARVG